MKYFPIFFDVREKICLVVGGGAVASRKAAILLKAHAQVVVVAPQVSAAMQQLVDKHDLTLYARAFEANDVQKATLVMAATNDIQVNQHVATAAKAQGIPVNVADNPDLCSFIMPSIVDRSPVQIAISTSGTSPVLARLLRGRLESTIPAGYGKLAQLAGNIRDEVKQRLTHKGVRKSFWEKLLQGRVAEMVMSGNSKQTHAEIEALLQAVEKDDPAGFGEVYLVGAGPGDPDLISFRALRLMQQADVVVYDRLVSEPILELVRRDAERFYVGKARGDHTLAQEEINQVLVKLAKQGRRVLRLKGGDPFIFGRGGEEIETLMEENVPFQVVPGITAASGCSSYAGIPLTHRDYAQACVFVTGHLRDGTVNLDWDMLARPSQTVVIYMGLHGVPVICEQMIKHGLSADTPMALVQQGTTEYQKVYQGTLGTMPALMKNREVKPPTLIIIGKVVTLRDKLRWFDPVPSDENGTPFGAK